MSSEPFPVDPAVAGLVAALASGLVIGLERGWRAREQAEGSRVAGLRTFALIGLFGGVTGTLGAKLGSAAFVAGLLAVALLGVVSYRERVRSTGSLSATSTIAALLAYALGTLAATGAPALAIGLAVIVAVLLDLKPTLHRWLTLIEHRELSAGLQMLVLSAVVLPWLPDRGYGPYEALNPYRLWWGVVLVAGLSLAGHLAMRLTGAQRGVLWTGLLGGLASSTATTLELSRRVRSEPHLRDAATAGVLLACGVMFLRMTLIAAVVLPGLGRLLAVPFLTSGAVLFALGILRWRGRVPDGPRSQMHLDAPFDLGTALGFGAFLGVMAILSRAAHEELGQAGLYALAAVSGLADVDAILISAARMSAGGSLPLTSAAVVASIAAASNLLTKAAMAWWIGGSDLGRGVGAGYLAALAAGAVAGAAWIF